MKKGFTILELLVASMLLGMLVTILTMIFNQSSIAWRTGTATISDLDDVRDNMAEIREEADNAFVWNNQIYSLTGLWDDETGGLRKRACDASDTRRARVLQSKIQTSATRSPWTSNSMVPVGSRGQNGTIKTYTVNVKSAGPDKQFDTWDDIWSYPDEFE